MESSNNKPDTVDTDTDTNPKQNDAASLTNKQCETTDTDNSETKQPENGQTPNPNGTTNGNANGDTSNTNESTTEQPATSDTTETPLLPPPNASNPPNPTNSATTNPNPTPTPTPNTAASATATMPTMNPMMPGMTTMPGMMGMMPPMPGAMMPGFPPYPMMPGMTGMPPFGAPGMMPFMPMTPQLNTNANKSQTKVCQIFPENYYQPHPQPHRHRHCNHVHPQQTGKKCGDWQSYITPEGKTYYFNVNTKETTWTKPDNWTDEVVANGDTEKESKNGNGTEGVTKDNDKEVVMKESNNDTDKKEHSPSINKPNGSSVTSNDEKKEVQQNKDKEKEYVGTQATKELAVVTDTVAKRSFGNKSKSKYKDRSERIAAFRALLTDKNIDPEWHWKKVLPKIINDRRYNALTKLDDRKKELENWQKDEKQRLEVKYRVFCNFLYGARMISLYFDCNYVYI